MAINAPGRESAQRLAKVVGVAAILASALSQEYGSGINFVLTSRASRRSWPC